MRNVNELWVASYVEEGAVVVRALGYEGLMDPVPDGESAIAALVPGRTGRVFGLTHGPRAHLFVYNDFPQEDCVIPLGVVAENAVGGCLAAARDGWIYGVVSSAGATHSQFSNVFFRCDPAATWISSEYTIQRAKPEFLNSPFGTRRVCTMLADPKSNRFFGIMTPGNVLFCYDLDLAKLTEFGSIGEDPVSEVLCLAKDGIYGAGPEGRIFRLDPESGRIEQTHMIMPCLKGKEFVNKAAALIFDPMAERLYGGTSPDGCLFRIELRERFVVCLGKPLDQGPIRCMTLGADGTVYGVAGEPRNGICHLFRYSPETGDLRDLGVPKSTISKCWIAHEIDTMCTNRNGHIVMGENDRMSHLLVYYPPVRRASCRHTAG